MLSYQDLRRLVDDGLLFPRGIGEDRFQPASIDLALGNHFHDPQTGRSWISTHVELEPGDFLLGCTFEEIWVPRDYAVQINGKSSWARRGLLVHATAGFIDPGFEGQITLELKNLSKVPITLAVGMRVAQVHVFALSSPAAKVYGDEGLHSHYQNQEGATPSRRVW